jgi:hypothetical protein
MSNKYNSFLRPSFTLPLLYNKPATTTLRVRLDVEVETLVLASLSHGCAYGRHSQKSASFLSTDRDGAGGKRKKDENAPAMTAAPTPDPSSAW